MLRRCPRPDGTLQSHTASGFTGDLQLIKLMADNKPRASIHVGEDKKSFSPQVGNEAERRELFLSWWLQRMRGSAHQLGWDKETWFGFT